MRDKVPREPKEQGISPDHNPELYIRQGNRRGLQVGQLEADAPYNRELWMGRMERVRFTGAARGNSAKTGTGQIIIYNRGG